jgi:hypothetical protein
MATSGTTSHIETRDLIITRALRICSAIADEEVPTPSMIANASQSLNDLVKQWDTLGIHVWTETEGVIFPQPGQQMYRLDAVTSPDHAAENWRLSNTTSVMTTGSTNVTLGKIYDFGQYDTQTGDNIGIVLDTGRVYWALVAAVMSPTTLILNLGLPEPANGNKAVFIYRTKIAQPLRIPSARRLLIPSLVENSLLVLARLDYRELPNKTTAGTASAFFYDPQLTVGYFFIWPSPSDVTALLRFTWYRRLQDFSGPANTPDLPQEWSNAITWNLAKEIAPEYDVPLQKYTSVILQRAAETLDMVSGWDREPEPTYFGVAFTPSSR